MLFIALFISFFNLIFANDEAEIIFAGDAMQHQAQLDAAKQSDGSYDYSECFEQIEPIIKSADYAVVNLETPLGASYFTGYPCFNAPTAFAKALNKAGFDLMLTANNHTLDRRDRGLHATIDSLDAAGISHIGTYHNSAHRADVHPFIKKISGIKVGFLNYTYGTNGITVSGEAVVDYSERVIIKSDIERLRQAGAEIITVAIHWGEEYKLLHNNSQQQLGQYLSDLGVDLVIGSHPHVIQPMHIIHNPLTDKDTLIVYSLGNFISNMKTRDTRGGALVKVRLVRGLDHIARLESATYSLVFTLPPDANHNFRLVDAYNYQGPHASACDAFVRSAQEILSRHNINVPRAANFLE